jgi:hypothetical protein
MSKQAKQVDFTKTAPRRLWMMRRIPELIIREDMALTLPQIAGWLNQTMNPTYYGSGSRARSKWKPWEYHLEYDEVTLVLKRLMEKLIIEKSTVRKKYDPKKGRVRYALMNPVVALAMVAAEADQTPSEPALHQPKA